MNKVFVFLALLSWFVCFTYEIIFTLKNIDTHDILKSIKKNVLQIIRLDKLFLIVIFIIYIRFNKDFITSLVFMVICLYMYINKLYEKTKKEKLLMTIKKHWLELIVLLVITSLPFIYLLLTKNFDNTYIILLIYILFHQFLIYISSKVANLLSIKKR